MTMNDEAGGQVGGPGESNPWRAWFARFREASAPRRRAMAEAFAWKVKTVLDVVEGEIKATSTNADEAADLVTTMLCAFLPPRAREQMVGMLVPVLDMFIARVPHTSEGHEEVEGKLRGVLDRVAGSSYEDADPPRPHPFPNFSMDGMGPAIAAQIGKTTLESTLGGQAPPGPFHAVRGVGRQSHEAQGQERPLGRVVAIFENWRALGLEDSECWTLEPRPSTDDQVLVSVIVGEKDAEEVREESLAASTSVWPPPGGEPRSMPTPQVPPAPHLREPENEAEFLARYAVEALEWQTIASELQAAARGGGVVAWDVTQEQRHRMAMRGEASVLDSAWARQHIGTRFGVARG